MTNYSLFGGCLASELHFPDLPVVRDRTPEWTLRRAATPSSIPVEEIVGSASGVRCEVTLFRTRAGFRLRHICTGEYEITADGSEIAWTPAPDATPEDAQGDLIGRVMPVVLHAAGMLCLHGSGVRIGDSAVAFLADSGYGKSTTAQALVNAGARLISDDALAIDSGPTAIVRPGAGCLRLRSDSATSLLGSREAWPRGCDGKHVDRDRLGTRRVSDPTPLAAVYMLKPFRAGSDDAAVRRERVSPRAAAIGLVRHSKIGILLGHSEAGVVIGRAAAVSATVPVYTLEVARDLSRIGEVVAQIMDWHAPVVRRAVGA